MRASSPKVLSGAIGTKVRRLEGATAIITGASAGIGEAIAHTFAREGCRVLIVSRSAARGERVAATIRAAGGEAMAVRADVTRARDVQRMADKALREWGRVDVLVNGVGGFREIAPVTDILESDWDDVLELNLKSAFLCARALSRIMIEQGGGRIISFATPTAMQPAPDSASSLPYVCAKAGVIALTKHLARQLGPHGICVNAITPGTTLTPRVQKIWDARTIRRKAAAAALGCLVEPQDSADAALFLAGAESRHITGANLLVTAGLQIL